MAMDIVDFDQETKGLKEYLSEFLYGKVVCEDMGGAYAIRRKNIEGVREIYTMDGNVIRKDGSVSSIGNPEFLRKVQKFELNKGSIYQEMTRLGKERVKAEVEMRNMKIKYDENEVGRRRMEIGEMERKEEVILGRVGELEGFEEKEPSLPGAVVAEVRELERQREKL
jgi:chromosome segregation ATPase